MQIQTTDFIPAKYDEYSVWARDLYNHGNTDSIKARLKIFTDANLTRLKEIGEDADQANRVVLLFEEAYRAAVKYREDLVRGTDPKSLITLAAFDFAGLSGKKAGQVRWLRHFIKQLKLDDGYSPKEDGALFKIVSTDKSYDFNHDQPVIKDALTVGEQVVLKIPLQGYPAVAVYGAVGAEPDYSFLGLGANGEFVDPRPFTATPTERRYYAFFVKDIAGKVEIGLPSDIAKVLVQRAG
ncbi:MAG: hypothetical protein LBK60_04990 [Verrucomicrobiales bacterium]|jgi:hypothetical protein|nr:hypothetical protein [Verrucomicrobiales bacterium]